jgi:hypothetical protein
MCLNNFVLSMLKRRGRAGEQYRLMGGAKASSEPGAWRCLRLSPVSQNDGSISANGLVARSGFQAFGRRPGREKGNTTTARYCGRLGGPPAHDFVFCNRRD